jgi:hypothetical protein
MILTRRTLATVLAFAVSGLAASAIVTAEPKLHVFGRFESA